MPVAASPDRCLLVDGQHVSPSSSTFQDALRNSYLADARPRCLCTPAAPAMYVAHLGDTFVLKRMPGTGSQHASWCRSSREARNDAESEKAHGVSIDPATSRTQLHLAFALHAPSNRSRSTRDHAAANTAEAGHRARMSLHELLVFLWERAELTHWHPSFAGRRNWAVVRARLLGVARTLWLGDLPLSARLLVPETFKRNSWEQIRKRRDSWLQGLQASSGARHLLLAELKTATIEAHACWLTMRHMPEMRLRADPRSDGVWRGPTEEVEATAPRAHRVVLAIASDCRSAVPQIHRAAAICCDVNWLPRPHVLSTQEFTPDSTSTPRLPKNRTFTQGRCADHS
ncbi:DUF1173 family protein [Piscinibacter sp. HJYY11]|nr:DUF1173 family protein [Piscinibacter sp. HJYY11]